MTTPEYPVSQLDSVELWLSVDEAAELAGVNRATVYRWFDQLKLHKYIAAAGPKRTLVYRPELEDLIKPKRQ